jgi:hypothetical protein
MNFLDSMLPLAVRRREPAPVRFERLKVSLGFVASFALFAASLLPASGQSAAEFKQPDYSQFKVEDDKITLEFWSWVGGLDQVVQGFEKAYPNIKVHVNNIGAGPTEYTKLQTPLKPGPGLQTLSILNTIFFLHSSRQTGWSTCRSMART